MYKDDKVKEAFDSIEQGVKDVFTSERFIEYLTVLSRFHTYSFNNTILILKQRPDATYIAGFNSWRDNFNRHVNKGEKAIRIIAPYEYKVRKQVKNEDDLGEKDGTEQTVRKYRMVNVFDISQTDGEPLPQLVEELKGTGKEAQILMNAILKVSEINIYFRTADEVTEFQNGAKGYYDRSKDEIVIMKGMDDIQSAKTLVHEFAHSILHKESDKSKEQKEIEAESIAFVICNHFGIDTSDYSFPYIASYAMDNEDLLKSTLADIQTKAKEMISIIEPVYESLMMKTKETISDKDIRLYTPLELENISKELIERVSDSVKNEFSNIRVDSQSISMYVSQCMENLKEDYPDMYQLYREDRFFRDGLKTAISDSIEGNMSEHPIIDKSVERKLFEYFEMIGSPVIEGKAEYISLRTLFYDDISIELLDKDRVAVAQHYELNGDLMSVPDIEFMIDKGNKLLYVQSFQHDEMGEFTVISEHPERKCEVCDFAYLWIQKIPECHYKVDRIMGESFDLSDTANRTEITQFCENNGYEKFCKKSRGTMVNGRER